MPGKMPDPTAKQRRILNECAVLRAVTLGLEAEHGKARDNFRAAVVKAGRAGCSIGLIAHATGLSRSRVQQLLGA